MPLLAGQRALDLAWTTQQVELRELGLTPADAAVFHELDIRAADVADLFARERFDVLVHHAAQMDVRRSVADPQFDASVNVVGMLNLMEAGRANGLKKVLFASTGGAIYGECGEPASETSPREPLSQYGTSKLAGEEYLATYNRLYGSVPRPRKIFSNPRLGGWKAVGYLWETGILAGDFRSINESFAVPIWYTFQTPRSCYTDPQNYWLRRDWQGWPEDEAGLAEQGYTLSRVVLVDAPVHEHPVEDEAGEGEPRHDSGARRAHPTRRWLRRLSLVGERGEVTRHGDLRGPARGPRAW